MAKPSLRIVRDSECDCAARTAATREPSQKMSRPSGRVSDYRGGPSPQFVALTRNPELAVNPPARFEPTIKAPGDVVL